MVSFRFKFVLAAIVASVLASASASAQVFGTFAWQMQPYCNVVTLTITQFPGGYTVDGNDNQCGAATLAAATGQVHINPDGTVGVNFAIITTPSGKAVHVAALLSPANGSGSWTDSVGNSGSLALGANTGGSPRPVPTSGVAAASITNVEIANNAITSANVVNGSLTTADLADGPRAAFSSGDQTLSLTGTTALVVRSVTINAPAAGTVIVNSGGYLDAASTTLADLGRCSLTTGTTLDFSHLIIFGEENGTPITTSLRAPLSSTRGFSVGAGSFTVNLVCDEFSGDVVVRDSSLTAMYFPG